MKMTHEKLAYPLILTLVLTAGCQPKEDQASPLTPLKPNVSKPETAESDNENTPPAEAVAVQEPNGAEAAVAPVPEGSGSNTATPPAPGPSSTPPVANPAVPVEANGADVPLAEAIPTTETPIWEPSVVMSQAHDNTCVVKVGDPLPSLEVQTLAGEPADISALLKSGFAEGKRLAVVLVWNADNVYAQEQFTRLQEELVEPFGPAGLQVIAIHTGEANEEAKQLAGTYGDTLLSLVDSDGAAFAKLATEKLPRTYLLDAQGKILWLDLEYSRGTRRDLRNALMYYLTKQVDAAQ